MVRKWVKSPSGVIVPLICRLTVDFDSSFENWVAPGNYGFRNECINSTSLPSSGTGVVEYEARLFRLRSGLCFRAIEDAIWSSDPARPWRPARIGPMLAFGAAFPDVQCDYTIVAPYTRTTVGKTSVMAILDERRGVRRLQIRWLPTLSGRQELYLGVRGVC